MDAPDAAFADLPLTLEAHFRLHYYAAVYTLIHALHTWQRAGGEALERVFQRHPFLGGYFEEMRPRLPDDAGWEAAQAWQQTALTAWEARLPEPPPLLRLAASAGLDFRARLALIFCGLVEEDTRFGGLFADLQAPLASRRPSLETAGRVLSCASSAGAADAWELFQPLFAAGLLEAEAPALPRAEWALRIPALVWDALRGRLDERPAAGLRYYPSTHFAPLEALIAAPQVSAALERLPSLLRGGQVEAAALRGSPGSNRLEAAGALARALGMGLLVCDAAAPGAGASLPLLGPLSSLAGALPVWMADPGPGETVDFPRLGAYRGPALILLGMEGGLHAPDLQRVANLTLALPEPSLRMAAWRRGFAGCEVEDLEEINRRFILPAGYIAQAAGMAQAQAALHGRAVVSEEDVRQASRALNRQRLDALASRLESGGDWDHLVVSPLALTRLHELEQRARWREQLPEKLGAGFLGQAARGVRALFTGGSGVGKTLAARILAARLGMDLYRVDLSAVVNKYIGETEKNLHRLLATAEDLDVVLLLDEGDALLGSRTEVRSANDRYANLETNYLLQRLETYQGIVLITSNAPQNIDRAFQRRMDVVVDFIAPGALERWRIWRLHLPAQHAVSPRFLEQVAARCALTGGQIRSAAQLAALLALDGGEELGDWHLEQAVQSEYRKAGATCPLNEPLFVENGAASMASFLEAIRR
ncbi:MAG: ATP-binding protein [Chloroflexi bacterium]|nr:ATP-binding protein [Chloroflexota bacterium]